MSELGDRFLLALADQGYGLVATSEDMIILMSDHVSRFAVPQVILEDEPLEPLLRLAIASFAVTDGRFIWPPPTGTGRG